MLHLSPKAATCSRVAAAFSLSVAFTNTALAADIELDELVVTASRSEQGSFNTSTPITVISRKEIRNSGANSVADLLRGRAGMVVTDLFGNGSRTTIGMRGFSESANANTLILVDGRRLNNADLGAPDLSTVALNDIDRIEILSGSAGVLFGDQAVGGVINIITRGPSKQQANLGVSAGSYSALGFKASFSHLDDTGLGIRLSMNQKRSDNYRDHNNSNITNLHGVVEKNHDKGRVFLELSHSDETLQTAGSLTAAQIAANRQQVNPFTTTDFSNTTSSVFRIGADHDLSEQWSFSGEITQRDTDNPFRSFGGAGQQTRSLLSLNPRLIGDFDVEAGSAQLTAGVDIEKTRFRITSAFTNRNNEQHTSSAYAQGSYPLMADIEVNAGLRVANQSNNIIDALTSPTGATGHSSETAAEFGLAWQASEQLRVFARVDQNYRFPKIDEQAYTSPGVSLRNQTGTSWEAGVRWQNRVRRFDVSVYRLNLVDEIAFDATATRPVGAFFAGANVNFDPTRHQGLLLEASQSFSDKVLGRLSYTYNHARFRSGVNSGNRISYVPDHSIRLALEYQPTKAWTLTANSDLVSSRFKSGDNANAGTEAPGRAVHNLHARYQTGRYDIAIKLRNITGTEYNDFETANGAFPAPEANASIELGVRFE